MALQLRDVAARRGEFSLRIADWCAEAGSVTAVLGTNGAGKSSLFGLVSGEVPYSGSVTFHARELSDWPALARARHIGVLPQHSQLSFAFTAEEVVSLGLTPLSLGWRAGRRCLREAMERTDTAHLADRSFTRLSGGERQRVALARVLLQLSEAEATPLLLLDEPTSAQDLGHQHDLLQLARDCASDGVTVIAILHDLNHALRYADRCLVLRDGEPAAAGKPACVLSSDTVEQVWGYRPRYVSGGDFPALL